MIKTFNNRVFTRGSIVILVMLTLTFQSWETPASPTAELIDAHAFVTAGDRISVYTVDKRIISMDVLGIYPNKLRGKVLVLDGKKTEGLVVELGHNEISKINLGNNKLLSAEEVNLIPAEWIIQKEHKESIVKRIGSVVGKVMIGIVGITLCVTTLVFCGA